MSLKKFLYFITEKDGRTRQIVNGVVTSLNQPVALPQAPDGNQEIAIGWERSPVYYGNIRNFSLPLGFVGDGRKILQNDFYKSNIDRELYLLVKQLTYEWDDNIFREYYKQLYKGQFDFSTFVDDQGEYRATIGIMDGNLQRLLKANEGTVYELPFDIDAKNVYMDGMYILGNFRWFVGAYPSLAAGYPGLFQFNNDNAIPGLAIFDVLLTESPGAPNGDNLEYFAEAAQDIQDIHITGTLTGFNAIGSPGPLSVLLYVYNKITDSITQTIDLTPDDPYPENYNLIIDQTIDLAEGDRIFLHTNSNFQGEGNLRMDAKSKPETSTIRGFTLYDVGRKLIEKITGNADNFTSSLLENILSIRGHEVILTSGDGVRGISNASLKTSWRDFWKFVDVHCMAQMTVNDKIRIEERLTAYQPAADQVPIALGEVKKLKVTPALDYLFTSVKVGHAEQQVDDTNGKFDFNGYMVFTSPVKGIPDKQLDLQSSYKTSPYEIEQTRANYEGKITTDKETDNDVFALAVLPQDSDNSFETTATFQADGTPFAPGEPFLSITAGSPVVKPGMKIRITGSVSNDGEYTIKGATGWFFGQLITLNEAVVDEAGVTITIEILEGQLYTLDRSIEVTQLTDPDVTEDIKETVFNIPFTPKRVLLTHARWLAGCLFDYADGKLIFSSANRNKELIAGGIIEKADVTIASLGAPMFQNKYIEFETVSPADMVAALDTNENPSFEPLWSSISLPGFFIRGGIALNDLEEQTFKLLALPDTNFLPLIS